MINFDWKVPKKKTNKQQQEEEDSKMMTLNDIKTLFQGKSVSTGYAAKLQASFLVAFVIKRLDALKYSRPCMTLLSDHLKLSIFLPVF